MSSFGSGTAIAGTSSSGTHGAIDVVSIDANAVRTSAGSGGVAGGVLTGSATTAGASTGAFAGNFATASVTVGAASATTARGTTTGAGFDTRASRSPIACAIADAAPYA